MGGLEAGDFAGGAWALLAVGARAWPRSKAKATGQAERALVRWVIGAPGNEQGKLKLDGKVSKGVWGGGVARRSLGKEKAK